MYGTAAGSTVSCHHVNYTVQEKNPSKTCGGTVPKQILRDISGVFKPGMNAILGATGSGKTSLLDILAGRKDPRGLEGLVLVDGNHQPQYFKLMSGYVVQDDVVMGTLTVRENLQFSCNLRLPKTVTKQQKAVRVDETISELGLSHVADSRVGTEFIRGVSGGERKRTNIGMELIISPSVLFLDEPTTGLDASTANAVMVLLHRLARKGRTIIFSIHQPRYTIFKVFDTLMLLSCGHMVYHGPSEDTLHFFSTIGHECEAHNNPPDFFLDVVNGDSTAAMLAAISENTDTSIESGIPDTPLARAVTESALAVELSTKYRQSDWYQRMIDEVDGIYDEHQKQQASGTSVEVNHGYYVTSYLTQVFYISRRTVLNIWRNPQTSVMQFIVMILFAVVVGLLYLQVDNSSPAGIQNRVGAFFFIIMNQVFGNLSALELFLHERKIFHHESCNGFYRVSAYYFAKVFFDLIPMRVIPVTVFSSICYFMIGLLPEVDKFFFFVLVLVLTATSAAGLSFLVSCSVETFAMANLIVALCYVFMMVFSGLIVNVQTIIVALSWIKWFSIFRYGQTALCINEMKNMTFCTYVNGTEIAHCDPNAGNDYLASQGIEFEDSWALWQNVVALAGMTVITLMLTYVQLRRMKKYT